MQLKGPILYKYCISAHNTTLVGPHTITNIFFLCLHVCYGGRPRDEATNFSKQYVHNTRSSLLD